MSIFSQDNISAILLLLPGKSLLRFKCVSKAFCSEIEDPSFVNMHLEKSMETDTHLNLVLLDIGEVGTEQIRVFNKSDLECGLLQPIQIPCPTPCIYKNSSCRGLAYDFGNRLLWNPLTRRYKIIPYCPNLDPIEYRENFDESGYDGFGYDFASNDYQIVRLSMMKERINDDYRPVWPDFQVWVYSLRSNYWRKIETSTNVFLGAEDTRPGVFVDGALHWVLTTSSVKTTDLMISTFKLATKEFGRLLVPDYELLKDDDIHNIFEHNLYNLGGRLACMSMYVHQNRRTGGEKRIVEIHVIEKHGNGIEVAWNKLFRVTSEEVPLSPIFSWNSDDLLAISKKYNKILMSGYVLPFRWFDPKENTVEDVIIDDKLCSYYAFSCWESLVDLGSDSEKIDKKIYYKFEQKDYTWPQDNLLTLGDLTRSMDEQI